MQLPDFWDFMLDGGYDLLFPDDEDNKYKCPFCLETVNGSDKVEWLNKDHTRFKCPNCGEICVIG